mgnify:CR=1 FL=1
MGECSNSVRASFAATTHKHGGEARPVIFAAAGTILQADLGGSWVRRDRHHGGPPEGALMEPSTVHARRGQAALMANVKVREHSSREIFKPKCKT